MSLSLLEALMGDSSVMAAELRPPRAELGPTKGMDAWIDMYHGVRNLTRQGVRVCLTDSAVGLQEGNNLRHLANNLSLDVPRDRILPFLTSKHSLDRFLRKVTTRRVGLPGIFGVLHCRSANAKTLEILARFLPLPVEGLRDEFEAGASPVDVCARTLRACVAFGARHFYISSLPVGSASSTLAAILEQVGVTVRPEPQQS